MRCPKARLDDRRMLQRYSALIPEIAPPGWSSPRRGRNGQVRETAVELEEAIWQTSGPRGAVSRTC